jgi:cytochrome c peroxidase
MFHLQEWVNVMPNRMPSSCPTGAAALLVLAALTNACSRGQTEQSSAASSAAPVQARASDLGSVEINPRLLRRFQPLPAAMESDQEPITAPKVTLGRQLFYDARLSKAKDLSCNSCHDLARYGADNRPRSIGFRGQIGKRNSPTVYNAAGHFVQFWDGRSANAEEQVKVPILNPIEMAMASPGDVVATLAAVPGYAKAFHEAFPDDAHPVNYDNVGRAIAAFERKLVTPGRWDQFLRGDKEALTRAEKEGLKTFLNVGCMVCHTGPYLGGSMFERAGVVEPWPNQDDQGRAEVTKSAADRMMFKVPSLRNIEKTAPYFHDGSVGTLDDAVRVMGKRQLGLDLTLEEVTSIVTWLKSLTGEIPKDYIAMPQLPDAPTAVSLKGVN